MFRIQSFRRFFLLLSGFVVAFATIGLRDGRKTLLSFATTRLIRLYPMLLLGMSIGALVFFSG